MTCRDDVGTTGPDKSESKRYLLVPNCFLGIRCIVPVLVRWVNVHWVLAKMLKKIFSWQDYIDFALADSVLLFNDGKRKHAAIFSQMGLDVSIHSHIYRRTTPARYVPALKRTRKSKKKQNNLKRHKERSRRTITN